MLRLFFFLLFVPALAQAQAASAPPLFLIVRGPLYPAGSAPLIEPEPLRAAIEAELGTPVALSTGAAAPHLVVEGESLSAVRIAFVGEAGVATAEPISRYVDVSSTREHATSTVALLAANLVRDEAGELLAVLRAQNAAVQPVAPAPAPALEPVMPDAAATAALAQDDPLEPEGCDPIDLKPLVFGSDFVPYVGTSYRDRAQEQRRLSLNFVGWSGGLDGFELSFVAGLHTRQVCGVQIAFGANLVNGAVSGAQVAMLNLARGRVDGVQVGMLNGSGGTLSGVQVGLAGIALRDVEGAQVGLANVARGRVDGAQLGLANVALGRVEGVQIGNVNFAGGGHEGFQLGLANISGGPVRGVQLGMANVSAGRVNGAMLGLLNVARDADAAIGVVNVLWEGRTHVDLWVGDAGMGFVGVEHGSKRVHNIFGVGFGARNEEVVFAPVYGIGVRVAEATHVYADIDLLAHLLMTEDERDDRLDLASIFQVRAPIALRFTREIALWVSPTLSVALADADDETIADPLFYDSVRLTKQLAPLSVHLWPGLSIGARFF
jgi:hypothetical protein